MSISSLVARRTFKIVIASVKVSPGYRGPPGDGSLLVTDEGHGPKSSTSGRTALFLRFVLLEIVETGRNFRTGFSILGMNARERQLLGSHKKSPSRRPQMGLTQLNSRFRLAGTAHPLATGTSEDMDICRCLGQELS